MSRQRMYAEDPTSLHRDVLYEVDEHAERAMAEKHDERIESVLDGAVAAGKIAMDERRVWRGRLRREFEAVADILGLLKPNAVLAEKAFAEDPRIRSLSNQLDHLTGVEAPAREYDETAGMTQSEQLAHWLAQATHEDREPRYA